MADITRVEGPAFRGRRENEEQRDVFEASQDYGASIVDAEGETPVLVEPVYRIAASLEARGGFYPKRDEKGELVWTWGRGTGLLLAKSSIPALMRVLADLLEHEPTI